MTARRIASVVALASLLAVLFVAPAATAAEDQFTVQGVDTSRFPLVAMQVTVPPSMTDEPAFDVMENGVAVTRVESERLPQDRAPVKVVLLLDTSGSMSGRPLQDAKAAARRFVQMMGTDDQVAIVAFSSDPVVVTDFTEDRGVLEAAIGGLEASGETALYDGIATAAKLVARSKANDASAVLLSDGGDTVSINSLNSAFESIRKARLSVFCVALPSPEFNGDVLRTLAKRTGGRFMSTEDSADLTGFYEEIARQLQTRYYLSYRSNSPSTKDIELDITVEAGGKRWTSQQVFGNPAFVAADVAPTLELPAKLPAPVPMVLAAIGAAVFLSVGLLSWSIGSIVAPAPNSLRQIGHYEQLRERGELDTSGGLKATMTSAVGYVAGRRGFTQVMHQKLEQAGLPLRPTEYMTFHLIAVIGTGLVVQLFGGRPLITLASIVLATLLPMLFLEMKISRRRAAFEAQLPDLLNMLAGSLRAGYALLQAVSLVVEEMLPPASEEFRRVQTEARLGLSVEEALDKMAERLGSADFRWVVSAINIQRDVGGNLAELLDTVAQTIRERDAVKRQISALTSEGRLSAIILFVLPFVEAFLLAVVNPGYLTQLIGNPMGLALVAAAVMLLAIGALWLRSLVSVEV